MVQGGVVGRGMDAAGVLAQGGIAAMVVGILDRPVPVAPGPLRQRTPRPHGLHAVLVSLAAAGVRHLRKSVPQRAQVGVRGPHRHRPARLFVAVLRVREPSAAAARTFPCGRHAGQGSDRGAVQTPG